MKDRIQLILKTKNLSPTRFADIIQVQRSGISHILSGRNKPSLDLVLKILSAFPEINSDWLLFGKGEMFQVTIKGKMEEKIIQQPDFEKIIEHESQIENKTKNKPGKQKGVLEKNEIEKIIVFFTDHCFQEYIPK